MFRKHGLAMVALVVAMWTTGALRAQEREAGGAAQQREGAAAGAQQIGAQAGAQRQGGQDQNARNAEGRQGRMGQQVDRQIAAMLTVGNWEEIQLGQFAAQKSQNPQVREFAQTMVKEHTEFQQKVQRFAPPGQFDDLRSEGAGAAGARPGAQGAAAARTNEDREAANADQRADAQPAARQREGQQDQPGQAGQQPQPGQQPQASQQAGQNPMYQIMKDAGQRCLQMTKESLNEKQGQDFDHAYIGQQIVAHTQMVAKLQASQNHVSPEFQEVIRAGAESAEHHLKEARTIMDSLAQATRSEAQPGKQPGRQGTRSGAGAQPQPAQPGAQPARPDSGQP